MKVKNNITLTEINQLLVYSESSPTLLRWVASRNSGKVAGCLHHTGYYIVKIKNIRFKVHRILYQMYHNIEDLGEIKIDHIDNDRTNNKKDNLRESNNSTNMWNRSIGRNSKTGIKGIQLRSYKNGTKYYNAQVLKDYIRYSKRFKYTQDGLEKAKQWLENMREKLHGEFRNSG